MNIGEVLKKTYGELKACDIESYMLDCQLLLGKVLKQDRLSILINREMEVSKKEIEEYERLVELRKNKMPVKYILETCEFMGFEFHVEEGVLIPRPDTETLVEETLKEIQQNRFQEVCDVCCGSGVIGISLAKIIENVKVVCYDISEKAESVTEKNILNLEVGQRVSFIRSDLLQKAIEKEKTFDVIVSNPPYIKTDVIPTLMEDVKKYEPYIALWGGSDGLDFYKRITKESLRVLKKGGLIAFEIGYDQAEEVQNILKTYGFTEVCCIQDLAGKDRVVKGIR